MKRLDWYIGRSVLSATMLAWLVVAALDAVFMLIGQLGDIGRGDYGLADAFAFVALGLPNRAYQAFPMAALIGTALGLGNLAAQAELDAFRLAGCSVQRLTWAVMRTGLVMAGCAALLGEVWAPYSLQLARHMRGQAIYDDVSVQRDAGFWVRNGQQFIQVGRSEADGSLAAVTVYRLGPGPYLESATAASRAVPGNRGWLLEDIRISEFSGERIIRRQSLQAQWPELIDLRLAKLLTRDAGTLSLPELSEYIDYLRRNGSDVSMFMLNYWQRWAAPLAVLAMLLLAVGMVLGPLSRRSLGQRLLVAVLAGLLIKLLAEVIAHAGLVYGASPALAAFIPAALVMIAGIVLVRRA